MRKKALGTYDIAKICHVAPITVGRWIVEGKLPFFTTGGGHRRVWHADLVKFLEEHNYPLPKTLTAALNPTILLVEDDSVTRRAIRRLLEKSLPNLEIHEAASGYEAGESIVSLLPALVILDIWLPGMDGFKVCQRIRANKALRNVRILAITGQAREGTKEKILTAGADAFLKKPLEAETLIKIVEKLIRL